MKTLLFLLLTLIHTNGFALQPLEHLIPASNYGQISSSAKYITAYDLKLKDNEDYFLQFIQYPSFGAISSLVVVENYTSGKYKIAYTTLKNNKKKNSKRNVKTLYKNIPKEACELLYKIYETLLLDTHYSNKKVKTIGLDGTTYEFFINSNEFGRMYGETWSPTKETATYYLVQASKTLASFAQNKLSDSELINKLKYTLINLDIKNENPQNIEEIFDEFEPFLNCNTNELAPLVINASMTIQEFAMDKNIQESEVGGILMVWRLEACELLEQGAHLYQETTQAIEKECTHIIELKGTNEKEYLADAKKHLTWYKKPSHVVIGWAEKVNNKKRPLHTIIASDGVETIKVKFPGYGYDTQENTQIECLKTPSSLFNF